MQLHCTAPTASVSVKGLILRVSVIWFQRLLRMCNFTPSATWGSVWGRGRVDSPWDVGARNKVVTFYIFFKCRKAHLKGKKVHSQSIAIIHFREHNHIPVLLTI